MLFLVIRASRPALLWPPLTSTLTLMTVRHAAVFLFPLFLFHVLGHCFLRAVPLCLWIELIPRINPLDHAAHAARRSNDSPDDMSYTMGSERHEESSSARTSQDETDARLILKAGVKSPPPAPPPVRLQPLHIPQSALHPQQPLSAVAHAATPPSPPESKQPSSSMVNTSTAISTTLDSPPPFVVAPPSGPRPVATSVSPPRFLLSFHRVLLCAYC